MLSCKRILQFASALALLSAVLVLITPSDSSGQQYRPRFPSNPGPSSPKIAVKNPPYKASNLTIINNSNQLGQRPAAVRWRAVRAVRPAVWRVPYQYGFAAGFAGAAGV